MSYSPDSFIGGVFSWFTGVVEDVNDPLQMGRIRVRCIGYHTDDRGLIKTENLPWASVMTPVNSASMSGIGMSATGVLPGSWVIGFFRDGPSAQDPIVLGTIPSMTEQQPDKTKGFSDPEGKYPLPAKLGTPDIPLEARAKFAQSEAYKSREKYLGADIPVAQRPPMTGQASEPEAYKMTNWNIGDTVKPEYPKNHVFKSESGHVFEVDDTPGHERLLDYHKSGTYAEIDNKGNKITTVVGSNQTVIINDDYVHIRGNVRMTIDGNLRQYVGGNYHLEVQGDKTEYIHGHRQSKIAQSDHTDAERGINSSKTSANTHTDQLKSNGNLAANNTDGTIVSLTSNGINLNYATIDLNGSVRCGNGASGTVTCGNSVVQITNGIITGITPI
jgi:hypothetical protein